MSSPSGGSGLSDGAKAGIGVGVPVAIAAIGAVAYLLFKTGIVGTGAAASGPAWSGVAGGGAPAPAPAPAWSGVTGGESAWNGVTGGEHAWNGVTGSGPPPAVPPTYDAAPIFIVGAVRKNSSSDDSRIPYSPHGAHSGLPSPSPLHPDISTHRAAYHRQISTRIVRKCAAIQCGMRAKCLAMVQGRSCRPVVRTLGMRFTARRGMRRRRVLKSNDPCIGRTTHVISRSERLRESKVKCWRAVLVMKFSLEGT